MGTCFPVPSQGLAAGGDLHMQGPCQSSRSGTAPLPLVCATIREKGTLLCILALSRVERPSASPHPASFKHLAAQTREGGCTQCQFVQPSNPSSCLACAVPQRSCCSCIIAFPPSSLLHAAKLPGVATLCRDHAECYFDIAECGRHAACGDAIILGFIECPGQCISSLARRCIMCHASVTHPQMLVCSRMHARSYLELALVPPVILVPSPTRAVGARAGSLILVSSFHLSSPTEAEP